MTLIPKNSLQPGQQLAGFQVKAVVPLKHKFKQLSVGFLCWYLIFRQNPNFFASHCMDAKIVPNMELKKSVEARMALR